MKTLKALKITSILNGIYCFFCISFAICLTANQYYNIPAITIIGVISTFGWMLNPTHIISFIVCLKLFFAECRRSDAQQIVGKKYIWIFIWPVITTLFYFVAMGSFIEITGGV